MGPSSAQYNPETQDKKGVLFLVAGLIAGAAVILFLLSFHIVYYDGELAVFPKQGLTFADTVVDVDQVIEQYNNRSFAERLRGEGVNGYLINKLESKRFISNETSQPSFPMNVDRPSPTSPPPPKVTMAEYNRVTEGMSYGDVVRVVGVRGNELSSSEFAGFRSVMYQWTNSDGSGMTAMFQDETLVTK